MFYANGYDEGSKITRLAQWLQVEKSSGMTPQQLQERPTLEDKLLYFWNLYTEILSGSNNVGYVEIEAFQRVTGTILTPWQASLMINIDLIRRKNG